jgi:hypothetical protein
VIVKIIDILNKSLLSSLLIVPLFGVSDIKQRGKYRKKITWCKRDPKYITNK